MQPRLLAKRPEKVQKNKKQWASLQSLSPFITGFLAHGDIRVCMPKCGAFKSTLLVLSPRARCYFTLSICDISERLCFLIIHEPHRIVNIQFKQRILWFSRMLKPFCHFCYVTKLEFIESVKCPSPAVFECVWKVQQYACLQISWLPCVRMILCLVYSSMKPFICMQSCTAGPNFGSLIPTHKMPSAAKSRFLCL